MPALGTGLTAAREALEPVWVASGGARLFGILHRPAHARDLAVVLLSSGLQNRAGPHRIYVQAARALAARGFASLRIDLPGVGDADPHPLQPNFDCHDPRWVADVSSAVLEHHGVRRVALLGLCAGARVAVRAAARDPRVEALVAWSLPVISGPVNMPVAEGGGAYMSGPQARRQLREWAPKLVNPLAWARYVREGKSVTAGWSMMRRALSGLLPGRLRPVSGPQDDFLRSMAAYLGARRDVFFAYGDDDTVPRGELLERFPALAAGNEPARRLIVVPGSDHTFTRAAGREALVAATVDWLAER